jgi:hypothetical protein
LVFAVIRLSEALQPANEHLCRAEDLADAAGYKALHTIHIGKTTAKRLYVCHTALKTSTCRKQIKTHVNFFWSNSKPGSFRQQQPWHEPAGDTFVVLQLWGAWILDILGDPLNLRR